VDIALSATDERSCKRLTIGISRQALTGLTRNVADGIVIVMPDYIIESAVHEKILIVRTRGYIDKDAGEKLGTFCREQLTGGKSLFLFNFIGSPVINSSGLSKLLGILEEVLDKHDGKVVLCGLSTLAKTALRTTGVLQLVNESDTEENGLKLLAD
jgi:anti-anti-sigma factor